MLCSPLIELYQQRGLPLIDYRGSRTAARWDEPGPWPSARTVLYDASWRAGLAVAGPEARKWLNGMLSANVRDLAPGACAPAFQLDPKGHILASLDVLCTAPDAFLLLTDQEQCASLDARLRRFVFISKLAIENRSELQSSLLLRGPAARELARREIDSAAAVAIPGPSQVECIAPPAQAIALWTRLSALAAPAGAETFERDRILGHLPRHGVDFADTELPQETGMMDRLDFAKGCYVGQEIVERVRARGTVHRHFTGFRFPAPVAAGTPVQVEGREVGRITSAAPAAEGGEYVALGYIRDPHHAAGVPVAAAGVAGRVEPIPAESVPEPAAPAEAAPAAEAPPCRP